MPQLAYGRKPYESGSTAYFALIVSKKKTRFWARGANCLIITIYTQRWKRCYFIDPLGQQAQENSGLRYWHSFRPAFSLENDAVSWRQSEGPVPNIAYS